MTGLPIEFVQGCLIETQTYIKPHMHSERDTKCLMENALEELIDGRLHQLLDQVEAALHDEGYRRLRRHGVALRLCW